MIKGSDKISEFPDQFNRLEEQVEKLSKNTQGIKVATWVTAISTVVLAIVAFLAFILPLYGAPRPSGRGTNVSQPFGLSR